MSPSVRPRPLSPLLLAAVFAVAACGQPASPSQPGSDARQEQGAPTGKVKAITLAVSVPVDTIGILGQSSPTGGWIQLTELHSEGLISSELKSRQPVGRLAEKAPSVDDGTISVLPDGRMRVVYTIRKDATWHDGTPFTVSDMAFSYEFCCGPGIPNGFQDVSRFMSGVEVMGDSTLAVYYKGPNFQGANLGPHAFWPQPRHILDGPFRRYLETRIAEEVVQLPYWTSEFVHLGPFRLTAFEAGVGLTLEAFDRYFLGRPKLDLIHVRFFSDQRTLLSNVLAGTIDVVPANALISDVGAEFKNRWGASGDGTVHVRPSSLRLLEQQRRPALVGERALLEREVRVALLHALDREALSDAMNGGIRLPGWSLLAPGEPGYEGTKDSLRPFTYDPDRSKAILREAGWTEGPGGMLRHESDSRPFRMSIWGSPGREKETPIYGSYWRQVGIDVEEFMIPAVRNSDREFRSQFPGWAMTGASPLNVMADSAAGPQNRWRGNYGGFEDPVAERLVAVYQSSLVESERVQAMRAITDYVIRELPFLPSFFLVHWMGARKGMKVFDDLEGAEGSERLYGGYARNSRLWDFE